MMIVCLSAITAVNLHALNMLRLNQAVDFGWFAVQIRFLWISVGRGPCIKRISRALGFERTGAGSPNYLPVSKGPANHLIVLFSLTPLTHFVVMIWTYENNGRNGIFHKISPCTCQTLSLVRIDKVIRTTMEGFVGSEFLAPRSVFISHVFLRIRSFGKAKKIRFCRILERLLHKAAAQHLWLKCLSLDSAIFSTLALRPCFHATSGNGLNPCTNW